MNWVATWRATRVSKATALARAKAKPAIRDAMTRVGGLSAPSKMPGFSYGLPARAACPVGGKLSKVPGSTCEGCYAAKGNYRYSNVQEAQARRLAAIAAPSWVDDMVGAIGAVTEATGEYFFRWHDSGDLQGARHFAAIQEVARRLPGVRFWLPTKEFKLVGEWSAPIPGNLVVRVSAAMFDASHPGKALMRPDLVFASASTTHRPLPGAKMCPAPKQGGECGSCRACWSPEVREVTYAKH